MTHCLVIHPHCGVYTPLSLSYQVMYIFFPYRNRTISFYNVIFHFMYCEHTLCRNALFIASQHCSGGWTCEAERGPHACEARGQHSGNGSFYSCECLVSFLLMECQVVPRVEMFMFYSVIPIIDINASLAGNTFLQFIVLGVKYTGLLCFHQSVRSLSLILCDFQAQKPKFSL